MNYICSFLLVASFFVAHAAGAKCASSSTTDRFSKAEVVVLVEIVLAQDGSVPYPYGIEEGTVPGKLLTFRVEKSWKGSLRRNDVVSGWTIAHQFEHAYPSTELGTKIIVFLESASRFEVLCCNASYPERFIKTSEELDAISRRERTKMNSNNRWSGPC